MQNPWRKLATLIKIKKKDGIFIPSDVLIQVAIHAKKSSLNTQNEEWLHKSLIAMQSSMTTPAVYS